MDVNPDYPNRTAVRGLEDNRSVPLSRIAERGAAENLRHVLPAEEADRVAVAAFNSSI
jgi:FXSXX-COOH protein